MSKTKVLKVRAIAPKKACIEAPAKERPANIAHAGCRIQVERAMTERDKIISVRVDQAEYNILVRGWRAAGCRGLSTFIREEALTSAKHNGF